MKLTSGLIDEALSLLGERLEESAGQRLSEPYQLIICGGAALISGALVTRLTTKDIDIVAMRDATGQLTSPDPLPEELQTQIEEVARDLNLSEYWLNNGPSKDPGGLFQVGLPAGLAERLTSRDFGPCLKVHFLSRSDLIQLKVYAAVDSGPGRHFDDLKELNPTSDEMEAGARWAMTQDPSDGFRMIIISMLEKTGYEDVAQRIQE